jgi:FkbH-like protein
MASSPAASVKPSEAFAGLAAELAGVDLASLPAAEVARLARRLEGLGIEPHVRLAYLGNATLDLLARHVAVQAAGEGLLAAAHTGAYGQYVQEVLAPEGPLAAFRPDLVLLALSLRLLRPEPMARFGSLSAGERRALRDDVLAHVAGWAEAALARLPATLLVANFVAPAHPAAGVADARHPYGEMEFYHDLNLALLRRFKGEPRVQVLDLDRLAGRFGKDRLVDRRMFYLAKMEYTPAFLPLVAGEVVRQLKAVRGLARKCLVLDVDNTLWGGVVGEEGAAGVKCGAGDPEGEAFLDFQRRVKELQGRGVLLALCSKNNPADVREVFATRPELPLSLADFAAAEISWEPKHEGLKRIARALGIGLDSLVFLDDNPAEVALVMQLLPEVEAIALPPDPAEYAGLLDRLTCFEKIAVLEEDLRKTAQYRENREREELRETAGDLAGYLASLETRVEIRAAGRADLARAHQLFTKTNQFNLTTIRYPLAGLDACLADPARTLGVVAARDRFGDLGTIAAFLLRDEGGALVLDSFLMSCRALGRGIESAVMNHVKERFLAGPWQELRASFRPTPKNPPAAGFLEREGFRPAGEGDADEGDGGGTAYVLRREDVTFTACGWLAVLAPGTDGPPGPTAPDRTDRPT